MSTARKNKSYRRGSVLKNSYFDGSAARKLYDYPDYEQEKIPRKKTAPKKQVQKSREPSREVSEQTRRSRQTSQELSEQAQRNRQKAAKIGTGYIVFLAAACILILMVSIHYLQLQTEITSRKKAVNRLESQVNQLKEENDAYYSQVTSGLDLDEVKQAAIGRLGMRVPEKNQIMTYETEGHNYVRQFQDIPDAK